MVVPLLSPNIGLSRSITESRELLSDLQRQLATGKKVKTYSDLGSDRTQILALREEVASLQGYRASIPTINTRLDVLSLSLERIRESAAETKSDGLQVNFDTDSNGRTLYQNQVAARFDELVELLNAQAGGRYLMGGRVIEQPPVVPTGEILDGNGAQAGFKQIVSERRQADLGADGRGRLVVTGPEATMLGTAVADPNDIGGAGPGQITIDIGGNIQNFDISDGGFDTLAALEAAIDAAFGADVASITGAGNDQLRLTATNATDTITVTEIDAGAAALAGLTNGAVANPTDTVSIGEDVDGTPFGFKLGAVTSGLTGTNVTGPAGSPPQLDVQFTATLPLDGETIAVTLNLPDGTTTDVVLTARANGTTPLQAGEFEIGADEAETAANFDALVSSTLLSEAQETLRAASLAEAADNFFDFDPTTPPQRVDGPPFDTATALTNATAADTVFWYQGELSTSSARASAIAKVKDTLSVEYGVRANEDGFRTVLKSFAILSVETFDDTVQADNVRYNELISRSSAALSFTGGAQSPEEILNQITVATISIGKADEQHATSINVLEEFIGDKENADAFEVGSAILSLQGRLEASLAVSASLGRLSLLNFL